MISRERYLKLREMTRRYEAARKKYDPKRYQRGGGYDRREVVVISAMAGTRDAINEEKALIEDYEWRMFPPSRYFGYYDSAMTKITGFMGNVLGRIIRKGPVTKAWGGKRQNVTVRGTNNVLYSGVCNLTGGTYCRLKRIKGRGPGMLPNSKKRKAKRPVQRKGRKLTYEQILNYYARLGSRRNGAIGTGDKVKVSGKFLRSTGQYTGPIGQAKGVVTGLQDLGGGLVLATIKWDRAGVGEKFNVKNLLKVGTAEHFENRGKFHRNPKSKDMGAYIRVTMTADDVARFKRRWPASGLPDHAIWFEFQRKNGDLVDISPGSERFDGPALSALADDAKKFAGL